MTTVGGGLDNYHYDHLDAELGRRIFAEAENTNNKTDNTRALESGLRIYVSERINFHFRMAESSRRIHDENSLREVRKALELAGMHLDDEVYVFDEVERITSIFFTDRNPPEGYETQFEFDLERWTAKDRKRTVGGRPQDTALRSAMHAIAALHAQIAGGQIRVWEIPTGANSHFPKFAAAVLAPVYGFDKEGRLPWRLSKFWQRERAKMKRSKELSR